METQKNPTIMIDLKQNNLLPLPQFIQHDTNIIDFDVREDGEAADFSNIGRIVVNYKRKDNKVITRQLNPEGNMISYIIGLEEMAVAGMAELELQFFSQDNQQRISTKRFKVHITQQIGSSEVTPRNNQLTLLQELFVEVDELIEGTETAAKHATDQGDYAKEQGEYIEEKKPSIEKFTGEQTNLQAQVDQLVIDGDSSPEAAQARVDGDGNSYTTLKKRLDAKDAHFSEVLAENAQGIGVNINEFPRQVGESDDLSRFQRAIDYLSSLGGGRLVIPNTGAPYSVQFITGSTITNPTRVKIQSNNIEIIGVGNPLIEMKGLDINYLFSIDDYASSGRDIFSVFSFCGVKNGKVKGLRFKGEYTGNQKFRYQSPRSIAVSFKGCSDCLVEDLYGEDILGNLVNAVHSYVEYDAPFANCYNVQIKDSHAVHCLENGFNYMGGTFNSKVSGLSATRCANGMESASDGLTVTGGIFRGNRSSGIGLSGKNQVLNGVIACESVVLDGQGNPETNAGYGLVVTGGEGVQINGGMFNDNYSFGIYIYPGVKRVYGINVELKRNATNADNKVIIQLVGISSKRIKDIQFTDCVMEGLGTVIGSIPNFADDVRFINNVGIFESTASALSFSSDCTGSRAVGNKFNKPITMNDPTGEEYNNGLYRYVDRTSIPTTGTWLLGDIINNRQRSQGGIAEWSCIQSGTFGTLNSGATTGSINAGSNQLTVNSSNGLYVGCWIMVAGVSGVKKVVSVNGTLITLDNNADLTVTNAAISYRAPVIIPSRQNGVATNITSTPAAVGFTAIVSGIVYKSKGTASAADWVQVS